MLLGLEHGAINAPITCGGVPVRAGDLVLADDNGVLIVPPEPGARLAEQARAYEEHEPALREHLRGGGSLADFSAANRILARLLQS